VQHSNVPLQTLPQQDMAADALDTKKGKGEINDLPHNPESFYQFIIDNNLFRSLGWQPPKQQPIYTLIGTAVSQNTSDSKAFILERRSNRFHIVKLGETLGDARVKKIQSKQVTLREKGKDIILQGGRLLFF